MSIQTQPFDFRKKYGYDVTEAKMNAIPDDTSKIDSMVSDLRRQFRTHQTRSYEFRISQL